MYKESGSFSALGGISISVLFRMMCRMVMLLNEGQRGATGHQHLPDFVCVILGP